MAAGSEEFDALIKLLRATSTEAVPAAEDAAAIVYRDAAQAAAPRKTGQLSKSVKIIEGKPTKALMGGTRRRLFIGPEKRKGYYGYWLEHGWTSTGTRRRRRAGTMITHGQKGIVGGRKVPARPWFEPSQRAVDSQAEHAAEAAFNAKLEELNNRIA